MVSYLITMRDKLEGMVDLVTKIVVTAKERQNERYERHARETKLKVWQKTFFLLLTSTNKL